MFGRDLVEQVRADSKDGPRQVPVIVEKCIEAVESLGKVIHDWTNAELTWAINSSAGLRGHLPQDGWIRPIESYNTVVRTGRLSRI